jgi:membrane protease subunit HflC
MDRRWTAVLILVAVLVAGWNLGTFRVNEWQQALVIRLGKPVEPIASVPGLYFRIPLVEEVVYFDNRLLEYDAQPREVLTIDKQQIVIDNYSRWRIADPLRFYETVRNEGGAQSRLDDILYSNLRENLGRHTLGEIVSDKRSELMVQVAERSDEKMREFGIEVVDVRIKRADLPQQNQQNVFNRMQTERERQAMKFRAEGEEEARKVRSQADKEVEILMAEARRDADILKGEGDALAVKIFADAYGRDPEFYRFVRTLDAYRRSLDEGTTVVLSPESEFFRLLTEGPAPR